jgi:hypothetical protein
MNENQCKEEFEKWVDILKDTQHYDMLSDPYAVWQEAWAVATMVASNGR